MGSQLVTTDARNKVDDLSGVSVAESYDNPYQALIDACDDDCHRIQATYLTHREARNRKFREKYLSLDFDQVLIDPFLLRLENPSIEPGFRDHRHCLVFWARPPEHIIKLACHIQTLLKEIATGLWLMPSHRMHMTVLEISHSRTPSEITTLVEIMRPAIKSLVNFSYCPSHRSRLVKPIISYDLAAVAISFLPAADEPVLSPPPVPDTDELYTATADAPPGVSLQRDQVQDVYSYHHLRRDLYAMSQTTGVQVASRYVVPSAHITIARFLNQRDHSTPTKREAWIKQIEDINYWLRTTVWDIVDGDFIGEWCVGQDKGLDCRMGALWYGGGRTIELGKGF